MANPIKIKVVVVINENGAYSAVGYPSGSTDAEFREEMVNYLHDIEAVGNCSKFVEITAWVTPPVIEEMQAAAEEIER